MMWGKKTQDGGNVLSETMEEIDRVPYPDLWATSYLVPRYNKISNT